MKTAESRQPSKTPSSLQAILHRETGDMETIGVPLPLPDAVVRVHEYPAGPGEEATYRDQFFRRVRSSDSVVRYYEDAGSALADAAGARRACSACGAREVSYFVRAMPITARLSAETEAHCATCYAGARSPSPEA